MRPIDGDALGNRLYHEVFEKDSEDQRWDSGCWMRYRLFERVLREQPTIEQPEIIHCQDCGHWIPGFITDNDDFIPPRCGKGQQMVGHFADDFCSYGDPREAEHGNTD